MTEVDATLESYAAVTREAIDAFLSSREPSAYLSELVREYPRRGGKGLRPALLLATCLAYGGTLEEGLDAAVAIELLHNAFLIHDDLQDASERRRGQPTLHALHGVPLAVNAGDALATLAIQPLLSRRTARASGGRCSRRCWARSSRRPRDRRSSSAGGATTWSTSGRPTTWSSWPRRPAATRRSRRCGWAR